MSIEEERNKAIETIKSSGLKDIKKELRSDKEIVMMAVKKRGADLQYVGEELKKDREFMLEIVKQNIDALKYAGKEVLNDRKFMMKAVKENGFALKYAGEEAKKDREIVLEAVKQDGVALKYAGEEAKKDREIVMEAIKQNNVAFAFAGEEIKNDRKIVMEVVKQDASKLQYVGKELRKDKDFLVELVKANNEVLENVDGDEEEEIVEVMQKMDKFEEKVGFVPKYTVVNKYPEDQIEKFDKKVWFSLARNELYNKTDDTKNALVEAILSMGAFEKDEEAKKRIGLLQKFATYIPKEIEGIDIAELDEKELEILKNNFKLEKEEIADIIYEIDKEKILKDENLLGLFENKEKAKEEIEKLENQINKEKMEEELKKEYKDKNYEDVMKYIYKKYYKENEYKTNNTYKLVTDIQNAKSKNKKEGAKIEREIKGFITKYDDSKIMTPEKIHRIFDGTDMKYKPGFYEFFENNLGEILKDVDKQKMVSKVQRSWEKIEEAHLGQKITFDKCGKYLAKIEYDNVEEQDLEIAKLSSLCGYSQKDFDKIKEIYKEQLQRNESSIPQIEGKNEKAGLKYKVLGLKDPTAIFVGELTDCCQALNNAGESCMKHSVTSKNGRILIVQDEQGKILSQSWIWRNKGTLCFDNIEAVKKDSENKKVVGNDVLETVKMAAKDFIRTDKAGLEIWQKQEENKIEKQKENKEITKEEYEEKKKNIELIRKQQLSKVTVGVGYTDVDLKGLPKDKENIYPEENVAYIDDSRTQLILAEDEELEKEKNKEKTETELETMAIYTDEKEIENLIDIDTSEIGNDYEDEEEYDDEEYYDDEDEEYDNEEYYDDEDEEYDDEEEYDEDEYYYDDEEEYEEYEYYYDKYVIGTEGEEYTDEEYENLLKMELDDRNIDYDIDPNGRKESTSEKINKAIYEYNQKQKAIKNIKEELRKIELEEIKNKIGDRKNTDINKVIKEIKNEREAELQTR